MSAWGLRLGDREREELRAFADLLVGYERSNVIGTKDWDRVILDHILDSLSCGLFGPMEEARRLADVGSGGGLPGIPIQITHPSTEVTLFESTGKKADFLRHALQEIGLSRARVMRGRVEDAGQCSAHRCGYDICTARAVARLSVVAEYCVPLIRVGGRVVAMKGRLDDEEMQEGEKAARQLGATVAETIIVPFLREVSEKERRLVVLEKVGPTPKRYPRKPGMPAKSPLGGR